MPYRENGQFKTSYQADQQIFPIIQDKVVILGVIAVAFLLGIVPGLVPEYFFRAILIPFLILALAALGLNILVGYCGQISLGTGGFMAVGAYAAYNFFIRVDGMPVIAAILLGGACSTVVGVLFGIPSLRIKGLYLAVATLAAQFFTDWAFLRIKWFTNDSSSGSVSVSGLKVAGLSIEAPAAKYLFCLSFVVLFGLIAKNLVRGHIGRNWMAMRDMDVAASVIGIRPVYAKLSAFAVSSFFVGGREDLEVGLRFGISVVVDLDLFHIRLFPFPVEIGHLILVGGMKVDCFGMQKDRGGRIVNLANHFRMICFIQNDEILRRCRPERNPLRGIYFRGPVITIVTLSQDILISKIIQNLFGVGVAIELFSAIRKFECGAFEMIGSNN